MLGFRNLSERAEDSWLTTAFAEMLSTEFAEDGKLRLVSGEDVAHVRSYFRWPQEDTFNRDTAARIGTALNGDVSVLGFHEKDCCCQEEN